MSSTKNIEKNNFKSRVSSVPLDVTVVLGQKKMTVYQVMNLGVNSVIELDKKEGDPVEIRVNNKIIGEGNLSIMGDKIGLTITSIIGPNDDGNL